jgi:ABC-type multidrug transport system permease subunit
MNNLDMPFTVAGIRVKRLLREKWGLLGWIALPLIIVLLMSLISGSGGGQMTGKLLITDHDKSTMSQFLTGSFNQGPLAEIFTVQQVTTEKGQLLMDAGDASAWVTIEAGFGEAFLDNQATQLKLVKNPAQTILPQLVESSMKLLVDAATYVQILFDKELAVLKPMLKNQKFNDADLVVLTLGIKQQIDRLEATLFPPQLKLIKQKVAEVASTDEKPSMSFGLLMFPGAIFMALIFSANSLAISIWDDANNGVLPRLSSTPAGLGSYFNGQVIGAFLVFTLIVIVLGFLGAWYFHLPWHKMPIMLMWLVFSGLVIYQLFAVLAMIMPTAKVANIVINATTFPLLMIGGSFFPMEAMPDWLSGIGQYLPNGFLLKGMKDWLVREESMMDAMLLPLVLGMLMLLVFWLLNRYLIKQLIQKV